MTFQEAVTHECSLVTDLAVRIRDMGVKYDYILGPSRGGLWIGVVLSHALGIPFVPLQWSTRDHGNKLLPDEVFTQIRNKSCLLVDDINDTGETIKGLRASVQPVVSLLHTAVLYQRYTTTYQADLVAAEVTDDAWIDFSWEIFGKQLSDQLSNQKEK